MNCPNVIESSWFVNDFTSRPKKFENLPEMHSRQETLRNSLRSTIVVRILTIFYKAELDELEFQSLKQGLMKKSLLGAERFGADFQNVLRQISRIGSWPRNSVPPPNVARGSVDVAISVQRMLQRLHGAVAPRN